MAANFGNTLFAASTLGADATAASSQSLTLTAGASIGDTVVVGVSCGAGASSDTPTASDSKGNTWTLASISQTANNTEAFILVSKLTVALISGDTITPVIGTARSRRVYEVKSFTGTDATIDAHSETTATSTSPVGSLVTSQAGDVVYAVTCYASSTATNTWDVSYSGATTVGTSAGSAEKSFSSAYRICGAVTTEAPSSTLSGSRIWNMAAVALKATTTSVQASHPVTDVTTTGWSVTGGTGSFASAIGETSPSDTDYVTSPANPSSSPIKFANSTLTAPGSTTGWVIKVRARYRTGTSGSLVANWYKNAGATLVATKSQALTSSFATYTLSLTTGEAGAADPADIQVSLVVTAS